MEPIPGSTNAPDQPAPESGPRQRILVVSGNPALREHLYNVLTSHGYFVTTSTAGQVGLEALKHMQPDLILANSLAHCYGGVVLTDHVRRFDGQLPIILLGQLDQEPLETQTVREIQACLPSNVSEQALLEAVTRWLPAARPVVPLEYPGPILLVDDEPELLTHLEEFLRPRGCPIVKAVSGEEALAQLACVSPSLVLLDIKMPGMDGLLTLKKIREAHPDLPVVMLTGVEDQDLMAQAFMLGAYEYITKPYSLKELEMLLLYLKRHHIIRE